LGTRVFRDRRDHCGTDVSRLRVIRLYAAQLVRPALHAALLYLLLLASSQALAVTIIGTYPDSASASAALTNHFNGNTGAITYGSNDSNCPDGSGGKGGSYRANFYDTRACVVSGCPQGQEPDIAQGNLCVEASSACEAAPAGSYSEVTSEANGGGCITGDMAQASATEVAVFSPIAEMHCKATVTITDTRLGENDYQRVTEITFSGEEAAAPYTPMPIVTWPTVDCEYDPDDDTICLNQPPVCPTGTYLDSIGLCQWICSPDPPDPADDKGPQSITTTTTETRGPETCAGDGSCTSTIEKTEETQPINVDGPGLAEETPGIKESIDDYFERIAAAPVVALMTTAIGDVPSGGECPTFSEDVLGATLTIDGHCTLLEANAGFLEAVMLAVWSLLAVRIILSA
jgi:hypothetical protein